MIKKILSSFISLFFTALSLSQSYSKCKIFATDEQFKTLINLGIPLDHGVRKKNTHFISDFSSYEINKMRQNGFHVEVLIDDVQLYYQTRINDITRNETCEQTSTYKVPKVPVNFNLGSMAGFFTYEEYLAQLDLMVSLYPNLISVKDTVGDFKSIEGRPIYYVKISDQVNQDENESEVLYTSIHHAREPLSLSSTLFYMWYLLENYQSDEEISYLVNETELFFIPLINPDGYIYNQIIEPNGGGMWRKNRRPNTDGSFGVDLNRNYSYGWGTTGISFDPTSNVYPGTNAFSEPETQAMKWFCEQRNISLAFNAHTYSNLILFPFGTEENEFAEDHDYFQNIANFMVQYNNFIPQKASDLYPASGDSDDYMYAEDLSAKPKIFAFTPEIGSQQDGFWPNEDRIIPLAQDMIHPNLVLAHASHNYWVINDLDPSNITLSQGFFNHTATRIGLDDAALTITFKPLTGIVSLTNSLTHTTTLNGSVTGQFAYELSPDVVFGSEIKYVLIANFGNYIHYDTIIKHFGNPSLISLDEATSLENWTGNWDLTPEDFTSASTSFSDSPNNFYANYTNKTWRYNAPINLVNANSAKIEFNAKWSIENDYDYVAFEVSTDDGASWIPQCGRFTNIGTAANESVQPDGKPIYDGEQTSWILEKINLNDYLGQEINIRFILESDGGVTEDGFYFDDFKLYINNNFSSNSLNESEVGSIKIFPNPVKNEIQIALPNFVTTLQVELIDLNGKIISSSLENGNFNLSTISVQHLEAGSYFIKTILNQKDVQLSKFIKM